MATGNMTQDMQESRENVPVHRLLCQVQCLVKLNMDHTGYMGCWAWEDLEIGGGLGDKTKYASGQGKG